MTRHEDDLELRPLPPGADCGNPRRPQGAHRGRRLPRFVPSAACCRRLGRTRRGGSAGKRTIRVYRLPAPVRVRPLHRDSDLGNHRSRPEQHHTATTFGVLIDRCPPTFFNRHTRACFFWHSSFWVGPNRESTTRGPISRGYQHSDYRRAEQCVAPATLEDYAVLRPRV
jgi:hypothetical protein